MCSLEWRATYVSTRGSVTTQTVGELKTTILTLLMLCSCMLMPTSAALPDTANWVLHIDVNRLRSTPLEKEALSLLGSDGASAPLNVITAASRLKIDKVVQSITLFGMNEYGDNAVASLKGAFDADAILTRMKSQSGFESLKHKGQTLHRWQESFAGQSKRVYCAFTAKDTILITLSGVMMQASLDALKLSPQGKPDGKGLVVPDLPGTAFASGIALSKAFPLENFGGGAFKQARDGRLVLDQSGEKITGTLTVDAGNQETAVQLRTVAQGMALVAILARQQNPHLANVAQSLVITSKGREMKVTMATPASQLIQWWHASKRRSR